MKKNSSLNQLNRQLGFVEIKTSKDYISKLLRSDSKELVTSLEKIVGVPIKTLSINNTPVKLIFVKKMDNVSPGVANVLEDIKMSEESQKDMERTFEIFVAENNFNTGTLKLDFINVKLGIPKSIMVIKSDLSYNMDILFSILTIPFVLPSVWFLMKAFNKKKYVHKISSEVRTLLHLNYSPVNEEAKGFIKNHLVNKK